MSHALDSRRKSISGKSLGKMSSGPCLPRFRKPPVIETVLGVHFRPLEKFNSAEQGILWDRYFRAQFPKLEERAPIEEIQERFGQERLVSSSSARWKVMDRPDVPRLWASSENGQHVVQIQKRAFFTNWLKTAEETTYRPYAERRAEFSRQLGQLEEFFEERDLGKIEPTSWNVTYINHIDSKGMEHVGSEVAEKLTVWTNQFNDDFLQEPDNLRLSFAFPMPDNIGRLNISFSPAISPKDERPIFRLELTARGQPKINDIPNTFNAIDLGHEWVVRGFASLTRPEMHEKGIWERIQ